MLIAQPTRRDATTRFKVDVRLDFVLDGETIGALVYAMGPETGEISLRGAAYQMGRARPRAEYTPLKMAARAIRGEQSPGANPILLTDASGRRVASAETATRSATLEIEGVRFELRRRSWLSRRFDLHPASGGPPLGSVGQESLFGRSMTADFTTGVSELTQAFLLAVLIDMTVTALDTSSGG